MHLAVLSEKQRGKETKLSLGCKEWQQVLLSRCPSLPSTSAPTEVSELKLASRRHQMLKHLTPETIATPSHARLGFLSPYAAQAARILKFQEYCSTCQKLNLKDALENQNSACFAMQAKLKQ